MNIWRMQLRAGGITAKAMHTSRSDDAQADKADWAQRVRPGGSDSSERGDTSLNPDNSTVGLHPPLHARDAGQRRRRVSDAQSRRLTLSVPRAREMWERVGVLACVFQGACYGQVQGRVARG